MIISRECCSVVECCCWVSCVVAGGKGMVDERWWFGDIDCWRLVEKSIVSDVVVGVAVNTVATVIDIIGIVDIIIIIDINIIIVIIIGGWGVIDGWIFIQNRSRVTIIILPIGGWLRGDLNRG